jgi:hypothetical protein
VAIPAVHLVVAIAAEPGQGGIKIEPDRRRQPGKLGARAQGAGKKTKRESRSA